MFPGASAMVGEPIQLLYLYQLLEEFVTVEWPWHGKYIVDSMVPCSVSHGHSGTYQHLSEVGLSHFTLTIH